MIPKFIKFSFYNIQAFIKLLILYSILNVTCINKIYAKDTLDTIIDVLSGLTCETQGVGDLLRSEFSHTCIPAPFFTFAVANILSPGIYANTMLRLKINDRELFNENLSPAEYRYPEGQCARQSKVDYNNPVLEFALCNNFDLAKVRVKAVAESAIAIAKAVLTGGDPWSDIADAWKSDKKEYHRFYHGLEGKTFNMVDIGAIPIFPIKIVKIKDTMCVASPTILADWVPIGCKYMTEPYPNSIYKSFSSPDGSVEHGPNQATDPMAIVDCGVGKSSCYQRAYENSRTAIVISAPIIECIKEMTARLLVSKEVCTFDDVNKIINSSKRETSILFQFQRNMHRTVTALLTLYVIFFGFKIILSGDVPPKNEMINFILKMLFVTYFSVGININPSNGNAYGRLDGMVQWAFPLLLGGIDTLGGWVINASPSDLCKFNSPDIVYNSQLSYAALWDALDCRVAHYLGLDMISTLLVENTSKKFDFFSFSAPPYVYLLIPAIISGNMTLISLAASYPLLVISVGAFLVNATVMCMISIVILGVLAPLFVPMFLFEYTRGYFDSWVKLLISFLLQPMVVTTFMVMMFSVYDFGFYGKCKYTGKIIESGIESSILTGSTVKRKVKIFYIDNDWSKYSSEEAKSCRNSLGYMLNNPLQTAFNFAKDNLEDMVVEKPGTSSTDKFLSKFQFLQGIVMGPGMLFASPKLLFEKIRDIILALITACFTLYLMYHFSAQLAEFAADMTEGVALNNVTIKPQAIFKAGMAAIGAAGGNAGDLKAAGGGQAGDSGSAGGGEEAGDSESTEGDEGGDSVATGGGGGGSSRSGIKLTPSPATKAESAIESDSTQPVQRDEGLPLRKITPTVAGEEVRPQLEKISLSANGPGLMQEQPPEKIGEEKRGSIVRIAPGSLGIGGAIRPMKGTERIESISKDLDGKNLEDQKQHIDQMLSEGNLSREDLTQLLSVETGKRGGEFDKVNRTAKAEGRDVTSAELTKHKDDIKLQKFIAEKIDGLNSMPKNTSNNSGLAQEESSTKIGEEKRGYIAKIVPGSEGIGGSIRPMEGSEKIESISKDLDGKSFEDKKDSINQMLSEGNLSREDLMQLLSVETGKRGGELDKANKVAKEEGRDLTKVEMKNFDDGLKLQSFISGKVDELNLSSKNNDSKKDGSDENA